MTDRSHPPRRRTRQTAFVLWGWSLLLLVLFSAAPSGAQPSTRLVGSAFDPSTVSVAVGPNKRDEGVWIKKLRPNGLADDAPDLRPELSAIAQAAAAWPGRVAMANLPRDGRHPPRLSFHALIRAQPARAPPLA